MAGRKGCSGRKALPAIVHVAKGTYRADRHGPLAFDFDGRAPKVPAQVKADQKAAQAWREICAELRKIGRLDSSLGALVELYATARGDYLRAVDAIQTQGAVLTDEAGRTRRNEWCTVLNQARTVMLRVAIELGLSPASRHRVSPAPRVDENAPPIVESRRRG